VAGFLVRGGGIEPPWLLTASTSTHAGASNDAISRGCERQATPEDGPARPVSAACSQNPPADEETIHRLLVAAVEGWVRQRDHDALRAALTRVLRSLAGRQESAGLEQPTK
jgi:hypothetical protein